MKKKQFKWSRWFLCATSIAVVLYPVVLALSELSVELYYGGEAGSASMNSLWTFFYALVLNIVLVPVLGILYALVSRFAEDAFGKKFLMFLVTIILLPVPSLLWHYRDNFAELFSMWDWRIMGPYLGSSIAAAVLLPIIFKCLRRWIHMGVKKSTKEAGERTVDDDVTIIPLMGEEFKIESFWQSPPTKRKKRMFYITTSEYVLSLDPKWSRETQALVLPVLASIPYTASKFNLNSDPMQTECPSAGLLDVISEIAVAGTGVTIGLRNGGTIFTGQPYFPDKGISGNDGETSGIKFYSPQYVREKQTGGWVEPENESLIRGLAVAGE